MDESKVHPAIRDLTPPYRCAFLEEIGISTITIQSVSGEVTCVSHFQPLGELDISPTGKVQDGILVDELTYPHSRRMVVRISDRSGWEMFNDAAYVMIRITPNPFDRTRAIIRTLFSILKRNIVP